MSRARDTHGDEKGWTRYAEGRSDCWPKVGPRLVPQARHGV